MEHNRLAQVLYTIGFMLGGAFGFIFGLTTASTNGNITIRHGVLGIFIGSAAVLIAPPLSKKLNN